ncbi:MAG: hypothetical protein IK090_08285 [Clostridia bacterium]|nr:hypothetical protein [Clostridia bacterium]
MKNKKIEKGIKDYIEITELYKNPDVTVKSEFAKKFVAFYRVRRNEAWREAFFKLFDEIRSKSVAPNFKTILETLHLRLKKLNEKAPQTVHSTIEASFVSKMLHTVNPDMPIWDSIVLSKLGFAKEVQPYKMNSLSEQARLDKCEEVYNKLIDWYKGEDAEKYKKQFDMDYPEYKEKLGRTKKIDFMLWGMNSDIIPLIVSLLRAHHAALFKTEYKNDPSIWNNGISKEGVYYILNQTIRQLWIPEDHYLQSVRARDWWEKNAEGDMILCSYKDKVVVKNDIPSHPTYIGASKKPVTEEGTDLKKGDSFEYRSFFHNEHIVPVDTIEKQLLQLDVDGMKPPVLAKEVETILDKIYICMMLKEENAGLKNKRCSDNYQKIIRDDYAKAKTPIKVVGFE